MALDLPPKSVDVIISLLQKSANEARFVNGQRLVDYGEPTTAGKIPSPKRVRSSTQPKTTSRKKNKPAG